mgnify:CR=1 FL=1
MPFVVSVVKYFVLALLFILLVGAILLVLQAASSEAPWLSAAAFATTIGAGLLLLVNLFLLAIMISVHDRHREIADGVHRLADIAEQRLLRGRGGDDA